MGVAGLCPERPEAQSREFKGVGDETPQSKEDCLKLFLSYQLHLIIHAPVTLVRYTHTHTYIYLIYFY